MMSGDNSIIPFLVIAILATSVMVFFMVVIIVTYTKRTKRKEQEYLRALMEDRERTYVQLSVELHDNVTNMMTLARIYINDIEENGTGEDVRTIKKVGKILDGLIIDTHHFSRGLNSDYISKYGLITVVTEELEWIQNSKRISCTVHVSGHRKAIPDFKQLMLYRIVQETLMNSVKYARPSAIQVSFAFKADRSFFVKITDNGIGFDKDAAGFKEGVGITSMKERARKLGGKLDITSCPGEGTTVCFTVPRMWK